MTLDDDLAEALRDLAHERHLPLKQVVNEAIRTGLTTGRASETPFHTRVSHMGVPTVDLTQALQVASELEDEEIIRKLQQGR